MALARDDPKACVCICVAFILSCDKQSAHGAAGLIWRNVHNVESDAKYFFTVGGLCLSGSLALILQQRIIIWQKIKQNKWINEINK